MKSHTEFRPEGGARLKAGLFVTLGLLAVSGAWWTARSDTPDTAAPVSSVRTARVQNTTVERTLRLTGIVAPERFASLLAPQLRGTRGGAREAGSGAGMATMRISGGGGGGGASSGARSSSSGGGGGGAAVAGGGGGGMRGGGGDFALVLQSAVPGGSRVKQGDVVAEFDRQNMITRLDDFKASLEQQDANLKTLQANLEVDKKAQLQAIAAAKAALDKARLDLKTVPVQSDIQAERLKLVAEEAEAYYKQLQNEVKFKDISQKAQFRSSQLNRDQSGVELKRIEANADRMLVRAPIDGLAVMGTVMRSGEMAQIRPGDQVSPGMMYMRIVDPGSMVVNASINQVDVESIRIGQKARLTFDAYPDLTLPARVYAIGAMPRTGGVRPEFVKEISVALKLEGMDPRVIPDLSVAVDVVLERAVGEAVAPLASVFQDERSGKPFVFVQSGSSWERRPVELGTRNNIAAVIRSGLRPGEVVAAEWPIQERGK